MKNNKPKRHKPTRRAFKLRIPKPPAGVARFRYEMPGDIRKVRIEALACGWCLALQDFPAVSTGYVRIRSDAQVALMLRDAQATVQRPLTNDFEALEAAFLPCFCATYETAAETYQNDRTSYQRHILIFREHKLTCGPVDMFKLLCEDGQQHCGWNGPPLDDHALSDPRFPFNLDIDRAG